MSEELSRDVLVYRETLFMKARAAVREVTQDRADLVRTDEGVRYVTVVDEVADAIHALGDIFRNFGEREADTSRFTPEACRG